MKKIDQKIVGYEVVTADKQALAKAESDAVDRRAIVHVLRAFIVAYLFFEAVHVPARNTLSHSANQIPFTIP